MTCICDHLSDAPSSRYSSRIHKYASCSNECFILALIYIDRLIQRNNFLLTELNVHRVVITAVLLAAKFFDDAYYNNAYYAKVGGVLVSEMNGLEVDFLFRINFSLHVTPDLFQKYREELLSHSNEVPAVVPAPIVAPPATTTSPPVPQQQQVYHYEDRSYEPDLVQQQQLQHPPPHTHYTEKRQASYITPSPPASQGAPAPQQQPQQLENPYMQRANSLPPYPAAARRCSPAQYSTTSAEPYFMVESTMTYPIHADTMIHHNHANKVEHGFHHQPHQEPTYEPQYFGAATMLCPGGS